MNNKLKSKIHDSQIENKYKNPTKSHVNILSSPKLVREYDLFNKENLKLKNDIENYKLIKTELDSKINRLTVMSEQNKVLSLKSSKAHDLEWSNLQKRIELLEFDKNKLQNRITYFEEPEQLHVMDSELEH